MIHAFSPLRPSASAPCAVVSRRLRYSRCRRVVCRVHGFCPCPPPLRSPPLRSLRSLPGGCVCAPLFASLRSARGRGVGLRLLVRGCPRGLCPRAWPLRCPLVLCPAPSLVGLSPRPLAPLRMWLGGVLCGFAVFAPRSSPLRGSGLMAGLEATRRGVSLLFRRGACRR